MTDAASTAITGMVEQFLQTGGVTRVHIAAPSSTPPALAYMVNFPRLSVILTGGDRMELELVGQSCELELKRGEAVFVLANCWNKPAWAGRVTVLTLLFGKRQTGISLVSQKRRSEPASALKSHFYRPLEGPVAGILDALLNPNSLSQNGPTDRLLVEALLHCCLKLLREPAGAFGREGRQTVPEHLPISAGEFQFPLTRDSVAEHFRLSPNHVSRLFRSEGLIRFTDYLTWVRLDRAKYMLRYHNRTLAKVARSCGFSDIGYFCRPCLCKLNL